MVVSTIHFVFMLVQSLEIISTFQQSWLHDTTINIQNGDNFWNQESKKSTKCFSEEFQMCRIFKKNFSAVTQEFLRNRKCPQKEESWAIFYGSNELQ